MTTKIQATIPPERFVVGNNPDNSFSISGIDYTPWTGERLVRLLDATYSVPTGATAAIHVSRGANCPRPSAVVYDDDRGGISLAWSGDTLVVTAMWPPVDYSEWATYAQRQSRDGTFCPKVALYVRGQQVVVELRFQIGQDVPETGPLPGWPPYGLPGTSYSQARYNKPMTVVQLEDGSLGKHILENVQSMFSGITRSGATQLLFSSITPNQGSTIDDAVAVRNPNCVLNAAGYDLSALSVWRADPPNYIQDQLLPGVLITPIHVYFSHVVAGPGTRIKFVTPNNQTELRTVVSSARIGGNPDKCICRLSAPIYTIEPMEVFPPGIQYYLPSIGVAGAIGYPQTYLARSVPCINISRRFQGTPAYDGGKVALRQLSSATSNRIGGGPLGEWENYQDVGDSNNPYFLPINGKASMIGTLVTYGSHTYLGGELQLVQEAMSTINPEGFVIRWTDLSSFTAYPRNARITYPI